MQGDNNLSFSMHQNISILKKIGSTKNTNIVVQWDEPFKHTTSRYKIGLNKLVDNASLQQDMGTDPEAELVDAARWAFTKYPAQKQALILWNHGSGILDEKHSWAKSRGILYDFSSKKCLTNEGLLRSLKKIQHDVLGGKTIDLIGMDACLMAMVEVAYQIKDFAKIFVASENIELTPGWHYSGIFQELIKDPRRHTAISLADLIVHSFASFNEKRNNLYTQSAIDLTAIAKLKENIATFASICLMARERNIIHKSIAQARRTCTEFDNGNFIDIYDFYRLIENIISSKKNLSTTTRISILNIIEEGKILFKQCILGCRNGRTFSNANGLSIYFPRTQEIHHSYQATLFAQQTSWPLFLQTFITTKKKSALTKNPQKESYHGLL